MFNRRDVGLRKNKQKGRMERVEDLIQSLSDDESSLVDDGKEFCN